MEPILIGTIMLISFLLFAIGLVFEFLKSEFKVIALIPQIIGLVAGMFCGFYLTGQGYSFLGLMYSGIMLTLLMGSVLKTIYGGMFLE